MSEQMAVMPYEDYVGACEAIRARHGTTDTIKSGELKGLIESIPQNITVTDSELFIAHIEGTMEGAVAAELLEGATGIKVYAFYNRNITSVDMPDSIMSIGGWAFASCHSLKRAVVGKNVAEIYAGAFSGCAQLEQVTFKGKPTMLQATVFQDDSVLADIYVPWSEGAVANAPWGASNATIHYNSEVNE